MSCSLAPTTGLPPLGEHSNPRRSKVTLVPVPESGFGVMQVFKGAGCLSHGPMVLRKECLAVSLVSTHRPVP